MGSDTIAIDIIFYTIKWKLSPQEGENLSLKINRDVWLKIQDIKIRLIVHDFANRSW